MTTIAHNPSSCCEPPAADFSATQTDDDPCTFSLTDESTAGDCGSIVSYRWLKNGTQFSTSQNPTGVSVDNGDDITLEVTDSAGCVDSVVMEIACYDSDTSCASEKKFPLSVTVDFGTGFNTHAGVGVCTGNNCDTFGGVQTLPLVSILPAAGGFPVTAFYELTLSTGNCTEELDYRFVIETPCNLASSAKLAAGIYGNQLPVGGPFKVANAWSATVTNQHDWRGRGPTTLNTTAKDLCTTGPNTVDATSY